MADVEAKNKTVREKIMSIRMTESEYLKVEKRANELSLIVTDYMRMVGLAYDEAKCTRKVTEKKNRTKHLQIRMTDLEYLTIKEKARVAGLTNSDYMRMVAMIAKVIIK